MASALFTWLVQSAAASTVILACGAALIRLWRQPVDRVRIAQWSLGATLAALVLAAWPSTSIVSLGLVDAASREAAPTKLAIGAGADPLSLGGPNVAPNRAPEDGELPRATADGAAPADSVAPAGLAPRGVVAGRAAWRDRGIAIIGAAYLVGIGGMLAWWTAAAWKLRRLRRRAHPVPAAVEREFARIARRPATNTLLLASDDIEAPITWGVRRPVIMLPAAYCSGDDPKRLRYCLAHEWAHVVRRDYATWQLATLLQFLLYYNPLFWRMRRALAVSMDQLADAAAAGHGAAAADYAAFLVELARRRLAPAPVASLGMSDRGSRLRQRIVLLVESALTVRMHCSRRRSAAIAALAILVGLAASAVRLDAEQQEAAAEQEFGEAAAETPQSKEIQQAAAGAPDADASGSLTYFGVVTDNVTSLPISRATVTVYRRNSREDWRIYETTEHETNSLGVYSFTIPPEQAAESALYLEVEAHHPDYAAKGRSGYSHAMILKNLEMGEQPWFTRLGMWPGEAITGTVVSPEGEPLSGVEISMYSSSDRATGFPPGAFDKTTTDDAGRFRIVPPTPGDGVVWIKPADYTPQALRIGKRRGDWGALTMQSGPSVSGRILDVNGEPVAGVKIEARRSGDGEEADVVLNNLRVANQIGREAISDLDGHFTLAALPDGEYQLQIQSDSESYDPPPLDDVFLRQSMTIAGGQGPESLEIRAVPHVVISATYLDSQGKPRSGHEVTLFGRWDGSFYAEQSSVPRADGKLQVKAPHGLQQVQLDLITNEHSSLRWRRNPGEPLKRGGRIELGTVEDDVSGIEIIRYVAPILLIKPVDEAGNVVADCQPVVTYIRPGAEGDEMDVYTTGGNVGFEHQGDGRWRSSQLLPDEPMEATVTKDGYTCKPQELSLGEGTTAEIEIVLKASTPEDGAGGDAASGSADSVSP